MVFCDKITQTYQATVKRHTSGAITLQDLEGLHESMLDHIQEQAERLFSGCPSEPGTYWAEGQYISHYSGLHEPQPPTQYEKESNRV